MSNYALLWVNIEGILPKGSYLPCGSMAGRALLAGYPRYVSDQYSLYANPPVYVISYFDKAREMLSINFVFYHFCVYVCLYIVFYIVHMLFGD